jgi:hypothetical protein
MLETLDIIVHDDTFWRTVKVPDNVSIPENHQERLSRLDETSLRILFGWSGYFDPPPPAVDEIIDEMIAELTDASEHPSENAILAARQALITNLERIRQQVQAQPTIPADENKFRATARRTAEIARLLIPQALIGAGVALLQVYAPGTGLEQIAIGAATKMCEAGFTWAANKCLVHLTDGDRPGEDVEASTSSASKDTVIREIIQGHVDEIKKSLHPNRASQLPYMERKQEADKVSRHLARIEELLADYANIELGPNVENVNKELETVLEQFIAGRKFTGGSVRDYTDWMNEKPRLASLDTLGIAIKA